MTTTLDRPTASSPADPGRDGVVRRLARWSTRHRLKAVIGWFVFVAVVFAAGGAAGTRVLTSAEQGVGESGRADRVIDAAAFPVTPVERILIRPVAGELDPDAVSTAVTDLRDRLSALPAVASVGEPVTSDDGGALVLPVALDVAGTTGTAALETAADGLPSVLAATETVSRGHLDLRIEQVGDASLTAAIGDGFDPVLLDGVTGSGKTEVYFEAIAAAIRAGRQSVVLFPEIALTEPFPRALKTTSLITKRLRRVHLRSAPAGVKRGQKRQHQRNHRNGENVGTLRVTGHPADEVDVFGQKIGAKQLLQRRHEHINIEGHTQSQGQAGKGANHAHHGALHHKDSHDALRAGAQRAQNGNVGPLVGHSHDQGADQVERRHRHDQGQNNEHHAFFKLYGGKPGAVLAGPVANH